ncbi:Pentatricopeptide repeat-containing protein [Acorus calamus]|uniref:Pentatricopeptide repeat-containing protein n=1 Tax=Acorus calamus TaxID=4465 RepID=A0AAV9FL19_ACOCL|nr:Pentatricopeptide repeat-containing protein [Acorus calamus]
MKGMPPAKAWMNVGRGEDDGLGWGNVRVKLWLARARSSLEEAKQIHAHIIKNGLDSDAYTANSVLHVYAKSGNLASARMLFDRILHRDIVTWNSMIDGAGMLWDAEELIEKLSIRPNASMCGALLNACRIHKNFDMGRRVGKILIELDPDHGGRYIHLASIFATEGHWNEAVKLRKMMKDRGVSKLPGCSSMVLKEIYLEWDRFSERLRQEGYVPLTDDLLLDLEEDEKEKAIHHHSEKLAIALALISTDTGTTI